MFNNTADQTQDEQKPETKPVEPDSGSAKVVHPPSHDDQKPAQADVPAAPSQDTQNAIEEQIAGLSVPKPSEDDSAAATPATTAPEPDVEEEPKPAPSPAKSEAAPDELLSLKHQALEELSPLVPHLDQNPEERFRTLMMMIQATDDHTKLKEAYQAAKKIEDDKARAQALLDVVNEINYFTQNSNKQ